MNFAAVSIGTWAPGLYINENYVSEMEICIYGYLNLCLRGRSTQQMALLYFGFTTDETLLQLGWKRVLRDF